jgi:hypothetical protein
MTFDNREGNKVPTVKLIAPIAIPHNCKSTIVPAMKLVCLRPPLQQMHWSKTFVSSSQEATSDRTAQQSMLLIAEVTTETSCPHITERNV